MTTKTRLIILVILVVSFLVIAPWLVFYSLGYRFDIENGKIVSTGGIYIRVQPSTVNITIDEKIKETPGVFSNSIFVQNLLPGSHTVLIEKDGYYDYQKSFTVKVREVTKLENVLMFSKNILFDLLDDVEQFAALKQKPIERFIIINNSLYYFDDAPENAQLTVLQRNTPILKNILAYKTNGNTITWLGLDGFLKESDIDGQNTENLSKNSIKVSIQNAYTLDIFSQNIFLRENNNVFLFDDEIKLFKPFYTLVKNFKLSPDGQKVVYFNDNEILLYYLNNIPSGLENNAVLQASSGKITDVYWLNNDYIIFIKADSIAISEIDYRGNINTILLPDTLSLTNNESVTMVNPEIFFDTQNKTLYILNQNQLISSDRIIP